MLLLFLPSSTHGHLLDCLMLSCPILFRFHYSGVNRRLYSISYRVPLHFLNPFHWYCLLIPIPIPIPIPIKITLTVSTAQSLKDIRYIGAMGPPGGGRNPVDTRFIALFNVLNINPPTEDVLSRWVMLLITDMNWYRLTCYVMFWNDSFF